MWKYTDSDVEVITIYSAFRHGLAHKLLTARTVSQLKPKIPDQAVWQDTSEHQNVFWRQLCLKTLTNRCVNFLQNSLTMILFYLILVSGGIDETWFELI